MKSECSIVQDLLPLYFENMVSENTAAFVKEHLENCSECAAEFEAMKAGKKIDEVTAQQRENDTTVIKNLKKKIRKRRWIAVSIIVACLLVSAILLHFFPVYRIAEAGGTSYFSSDEIAKLVYIGSGTDRAAAQAVLREADAAFHDCTHTRAENEELYGVLSRYATDTERGENVAYINHSLELWSAHLGDTEGYLWVCYSFEVVDFYGRTVHGGQNIPALWKVEKNDAGVWVVVQIKEHS